MSMVGTIWATIYNLWTLNIKFHSFKVVHYPLSWLVAGLCLMVEYLLQILGVDAAVLSESQNLDSLNDSRSLVLLIALMYFSATTAGYYINRRAFGNCKSKWECAEWCRSIAAKLFCWSALRGTRSFVLHMDYSPGSYKCTSVHHNCFIPLTYFICF